VGKEVVAYFKVPSQNLPGRDEENHEKPQSGQLVSQPKLKVGTFWRQTRYSI